MLIVMGDYEEKLTWIVLMTHLVSVTWYYLIESFHVCFENALENIQGDSKFNTKNLRSK